MIHSVGQNADEPSLEVSVRWFESSNKLKLIVAENDLLNPSFMDEDYCSRSYAIYLPVYWIIIKYLSI